MKSRDSLDFRQDTAVTACFIARYAVRGKAYREGEDENEWHCAAIILLTTLIMDLENGDYFANLFRGSVSALDSKGIEIEHDGSDVSATAVSLARELQDLSINAGSLQLSNCRAAVSDSNDGEFEEMQAMISTVKLTDSRTPVRLPGDVRRQ